MKIICFGDSNTWGYDPRGYLGGRYDDPWPSILASKLSCRVVNQGENGREIPCRSAFFPEDTDLVIVMLGTNDLLQGAVPEAVCCRMRTFLASLDPDKTLLIAPPPVKPGEWVTGQLLIAYSKMLAEGYQTLAKQLRLRFADAGAWNVPLSYDGVHFTAEGHRIFADGLIEYLNKGG